MFNWFNEKKKEIFENNKMNNLERVNKFCKLCEESLKNISKFVEPGDVIQLYNSNTKRTYLSFVDSNRNFLIYEIHRFGEDVVDKSGVRKTSDIVYDKVNHDIVVFPGDVHISHLYRCDNPDVGTFNFEESYVFDGEYTDVMMDTVRSIFNNMYQCMF